MHRRSVFVIHLFSCTVCIDRLRFCYGCEGFLMGCVGRQLADQRPSGLIQPERRARRVRRWLCRQHQGRALAPDSPLGPRPPHQPRTPRRLRIRSGHRRRRRHPDPDAGSVLPQDGVVRVAAGRFVRRRPGVSSARRRCARACKAIVERIVTEEGQTLLGWREVPINLSKVGKTRRVGGAGLRASVCRGRELR